MYNICIYVEYMYYISDTVKENRIFGSEDGGWAREAGQQLLATTWGKKRTRRAKHRAYLYRCQIYQ